MSVAQSEKQFQCLPCKRAKGGSASRSNDYLCFFGQKHRQSVAASAAAAAAGKAKRYACHSVLHCAKREAEEEGRGFQITAKHLVDLCFVEHRHETSTCAVKADAEERTWSVRHRSRPALVSLSVFAAALSSLPALSLSRFRADMSTESDSIP